MQLLPTKPPPRISIAGHERLVALLPDMPEAEGNAAQAALMAEVEAINTMVATAPTTQTGLQALAVYLREERQHGISWHVDQTITVDGHTTRYARPHRGRRDADCPAGGGAGVGGLRNAKRGPAVVGLTGLFLEHGRAMVMPFDSTRFSIVLIRCTAVTLRTELRDKVYHHGDGST
jgi:hypothetical protein